MIVINNAIGQQFKNPNHPANYLEGLEDKYVAAAGHYGNKSPFLLKHYAEDLGFEYLSASNKEEFNTSIERFFSKEITDKPIIFEIFTDTKDETDALISISSIERSMSVEIKRYSKRFVKRVLCKLVKRIK